MGINAEYMGVLVREQSAAMNANEFLVVLEKTKQLSKVGLDINHQDGATLKILKVKEGLASQWNATHPDMRIEPDHRIISVNSVHGSAQRMLATFAKDNTLRIVVQRR